MSLYRPKTTLEQWRILQAVVDFGGYAHAAEKLNKSQSSLNHAVAKLQQTLGIQLLEVRGRKAHLTETGEVMLRRSRQLTQGAQELEQLANNLNEGWEPEIRLAIEMVYDREPLLPILRQFEDHSRGSRLVIEDTVLTGTVEYIVNRSADVVITHQVPKGFVGEPLGEFSMDLVCHPNHPLAQLPQPIAQQELSRHLQIVIRDTAAQPIETDGWLKAEQRWTVSHFDEALRLVKSGLGFCWMPSYISQAAMLNGELKKLMLEGSSCRKGALHLVLPKGEQTGPCARQLADLIVTRSRQQHAAAATPAFPHPVEGGA
ncbi:LysR family transcriptional regulator [Idiomarina tyrosinivorans]|uniref:LysR family transcriptional regulator n=1 Tax=Idiomarina tyrosinivorans TaxID=1445662 RepID=A0A432ZPK5_9GAMM|nr:LysR family transcriptional regulator [Idiomarina tyrosinivorans]RUO79782.1 LysR family transcriptional regulator [Idiomarina tyrosinivorans]